ncbi:MAG: helicase-exonuclease AddAB subunit AddA [Pseudobutyrivibrio sp.]|nr:helicase-exonuclease AddAB subunit AddA [Pseudobutyrivibrio sp.]
MGLSKAQELVRDTRNKNMLVSAAAGSGKTFVLVKRIISQILDKTSPIDVDQLLVVTFTTAAAAEMKDRIRRAIEEALEANPSDTRLRTQATLVHGAQIRTIDSFCSWVVKNYFYEIDLDPGFRIASAGELKMLEDEIVSDLISDKIKEADKDFMVLADAYVSGGNIDTLSGLVFQLYTKACSFPWVDEWLDSSIRLYDISTVEELIASDFMGEMNEYADLLLDSILSNIKYIISLYPEGDSSKDLLVFKEDYALFSSIKNARGYTRRMEILQGMSFSKLLVKDSSLDPLAVDYVKKVRDGYKKDANELASSFYAMSLEDIVETIQYIRGQALALINLTKEFAQRLLDEKQKRKIFDFNDIEHMALEILRDKENPDHPITHVAAELANHFKEIMVDEYQDSNELQESILTAISSGNNYFTVGDVKQSIYAFREADPSLFIHKQNTYPLDDSSDSIRIDLDQNFRSRPEVLEFCNNVFFPLMHKDMGGVDYDDSASLKAGVTDFLGEAMDYKTEILIGDVDKAAMREAGIGNDDELEAAILAKKIKELINGSFMVSDKRNDERILRPVRYKDIVILMRSVGSHGDKFLNVLRSSGIPAYLAEEKGFFDREEIETVLAMLTVIDNPFNDISLAAVLHSKLFDFSSERLAEIRVNSPEDNLYQALLNYKVREDAKDVNDFLDTLNHFRELAVDTPIHDLIGIILRESGYGIYVSALPNGESSVANLDKLIDEAVKFENTSYKGLSKFVAYIQGLRSYDEDLGLAKTLGENDNAVRIMTIHKSKGLEFPVVFLSGCGKGIASRTGDFAIDKNLGLALNYKNPDNMSEFKTPFYNLIKAKNAADDRGEYLRILYVALTRAVDKMFVTGTVSYGKKSTALGVVASYSGDEEVLPYLTKSKATSSLELIIRSINARHYEVAKQILTVYDLTLAEISETIEREEIRRNLYSLKEAISPELGEKIAHNLVYEYRGLSQGNYKTKYSVSEIKHAAMEEIFEEEKDLAAPAFIFEEEEVYIPSFMQEKELEGDSDKVPAGALYGTAMHRYMECFDFSLEDYKNTVDSQREYMNSLHLITAEEDKRLSRVKLKKFMESELAKRMHEAELKGLLYKEKPFVFGSNPLELFADSEAYSDLILVQGIIDVFFQEDDGIVLMDYKTDRVDSETELVLRYEKQLDLYKDAIERAYDTKVKEVLIYSFCLDKTIIVRS